MCISRVGNSVPAWNVSFWLLWRVRCDKCDGIVGIVLKYTWPQRYRHNNHNDTFHAGTYRCDYCDGIVEIVFKLTWPQRYHRTNHSEPVTIVTTIHFTPERSSPPVYMSCSSAIWACGVRPQCPPTILYNIPNSSSMLNVYDGLCLSLGCFVKHNGPDAASHTPHVGLCKGEAAVTSSIHPLNRKHCNIGWIQICLYKFNESYSFICSDNHIWLRLDI